jgi:transcription antitermination factor NusG
MEMLHIPNWYIVYTCPGREKKVAEIFSQKNIKHYCPIKRVKPQISGWFKTTFEPLFPSYIFVQVALVSHSSIKRIYEVISFVQWLGKPALVRNEEIETIKKFLSLYTDVLLEKIPVRTNGTISVMDNPLIREKGMVQEVMNGFVKVQLPSLGYALKASVSWESIKPTDTLLSHNYETVLSGNFTGSLSTEIRNSGN